MKRLKCAKSIEKWVASATSIKGLLLSLPKSVRGRIREVLWIAAGQLFSLVLSFFSVRFLTSLGPAQFGEYSLILTVSGILSAIWFGPLEQSFVRFYFDYSLRGETSPYVNVFYKFMSSSVFVYVALVSLLLLVLPIKVSTFSFGAICLAGFYVLVSAGANPFFSLMNLLRRRSLNSIIQILEKATVVLLLWFVLKTGTLSLPVALGILGGACFLALVGRAVFLHTLFRKSEVRPARGDIAVGTEITKTIVTFGWPFVLWGVAGWLQMSSDRWIIEKYLSTADVGIYSLLMVLSNVLIATPYGIGAQFVLPPIYEKFSDKENRVARAQGDRYLRMFVIGIAVIVGVAVFVSAVFGRVMVLVVGGEKYVGESYLLPLLVLGGGFFHIGQSLCLKGLALNRPRIYAIPKVGGGFLAVGMNILMVNWFGLPGVVWTVLIIGVYYLVAVSLTNRLFLKGPEIQ